MSSTTTKKTTAAAASTAAADKKSKIVVFKVKDLDNMPRKRLVSLAKRVGEKANQNSAALVEALKKYYSEHESEIKEKQSELDSKPKASKKRDMTKDLASRIHYKDRVSEN